jgi:DNA-binding GntR family transcriptional regulator
LDTIPRKTVHILSALVENRLAAYRPQRRTKPPALSKDEIYERIRNAIAEHRLMPGAKLSEDRLGAIYGVSRTVIRGVLQRLAHEMLITLLHNRGAFVASPTPKDAHDVFEARRLIEPRLIEDACKHATRAQITKLRALVRQEERARSHGDRHTTVRLSGEFHMAVAAIAGNRMLTRAMQELTSLTCLIILLYDAPTATACPNDEHAALVDCIEQGSARAAVRTMLEHLDHIEEALELNPRPAGQSPLEEVLGIRRMPATDSASSKA